MSFQVELKEAQNFARIWNKGGVTILLTPEAVEFAKDFANVVLNNFAMLCQEQVKVEAQKPKQLIVEGVR